MVLTSLREAPTSVRRFVCPQALGSLALLPAAHTVCTCIQQGLRGFPHAAYAYQPLQHFYFALHEPELLSPYCGSIFAFFVAVSSTKPISGRIL
jgi:hypothetical protein